MSDLVPVPQEEGVIIVDALPPYQLDKPVIESWLATKRSDHTQRVYRHDIQEFYLFSGKRLEDLILPDIQAYDAALQHATYEDKHGNLKHYEASTRSRKLACIKSLLTFCHNQGLLKVNVGKAQLLPQGRETLVERILSPEQVQRMLFVAEQQGNQRNYVLLLLLYRTAIRCAELCHLQWRSVVETDNGGQITVCGKGSKNRTIHLSPSTWDAMQSLRTPETRHDDYVFQSRQSRNRHGDHTSRRLDESRVWRIVARIATDAGVRKEGKPVSPHWMRHAHATHAIQGLTTKGRAPLRLIQETLGHADLRTPAKYQHVMPEESSGDYLPI